MISEAMHHGLKRFNSIVIITSQWCRGVG